MPLSCLAGVATAIVKASPWPVTCGKAHGFNAVVAWCHGEAHPEIVAATVDFASAAVTVEAGIVSWRTLKGSCALVSSGVRGLYGWGPLTHCWSGSKFCFNGMGSCLSPSQNKIRFRNARGRARERRESCAYGVGKFCGGNRAKRSAYVPSVALGDVANGCNIIEEAGRCYVQLSQDGVRRQIKVTEGEVTEVGGVVTGRKVKYKFCDEAPSEPYLLPESIVTAAPIVVAPGVPRGIMFVEFEHAGKTVRASMAFRYGDHAIVPWHTIKGVRSFRIGSFANGKTIELFTENAMRIDPRYEQVATADDVAAFPVSAVAWPQLAVKQIDERALSGHGHGVVDVYGIGADGQLQMCTGCLIEQGPEALRGRLHHKANTLPGSSGSPLYKTENGVNRIAGIHLGGDATGGYNAALSAHAFYFFLSEVCLARPMPQVSMQSIIDSGVREECRVLAESLLYAKGTGLTNLFCPDPVPESKGHKWKQALYDKWLHEQMHKADEEDRYYRNSGEQDRDWDAGYDHIGELADGGADKPLHHKSRHGGHRLKKGAIQRESLCTESLLAKWFSDDGEDYSPPDVSLLALREDAECLSDEDEPLQVPKGVPVFDISDNVGGPSSSSTAVDCGACVQLPTSTVGPVPGGACAQLPTGGVESGACAQLPTETAVPRLAGGKAVEASQPLTADTVIPEKVSQNARKKAYVASLKKDLADAKAEISKLKRPAKGAASKVAKVLKKQPDAVVGQSKFARCTETDRDHDRNWPATPPRSNGLWPMTSGLGKFWKSRTDEPDPPFKLPSLKQISADSHGEDFIDDRVRELLKDVYSGVGPEGGFGNLLSARYIDPKSMLASAPFAEFRRYLDECGVNEIGAVAPKKFWDSMSDAAFERVGTYHHKSFIKEKKPRMTAEKALVALCAAGVFEDYPRELWEVPPRDRAAILHSLESQARKIYSSRTRIRKPRERQAVNSWLKDYDDSVPHIMRGESSVRHLMRKYEDKCAGWSARRHHASKREWARKHQDEALYLVACRILLRFAWGQQLPCMSPLESIKAGVADPRQASIKPEPHSPSKIASGAFRIIWISSFIDSLTQAILFKAQEDADKATYQGDRSSNTLAGLGHHDEGFEQIIGTVRRNFGDDVKISSSDASSWDLTVNREDLLLDCERRCLHVATDLNGIQFTENERAVIVCMMHHEAWCNSMHVLAFEGELWAPSAYGKTASGIEATTGQNGAIRVLKARLAGAVVALAIGDDMLCYPEPRWHRLRQCGVITKPGVRLSTLKEGIELTSHEISFDHGTGVIRTRFLNFLKMAYRLCYKEVTPDVLGGCRFVIRHSPRDTELLRVLSVQQGWPWEESVAFIHPGDEDDC